jgi:glutamyl-tRNA synthetase
MESLRWLGILWDEGPDKGGAHGPYLQSERLSIYREYAERLIKKGCAYPDPYTEEELGAFRKQAEEEKRPFLFREHRPDTIKAWDGKSALRFKVPEVKRYEWDDVARGRLSAGVEALDDFILIKGDGYPTYNFAHIIDDLLMEVTHIVRGEEFISSTPKFLSLYEALQITPPHIATVPIILGKEGTKKLSKRDGAKDILEYREEGYLPEAMVNFLALLGWHPEGNEEILSTQELIQAFDLTRVQKGGAMFDEEKLLHINREWMRKLSDEEYLAKGGFTSSHSERLLKSVPLLKERARTFGEAKEMISGELSCLFEIQTLDKALLTSKEPEGRGGATKAYIEAQISILANFEPSVGPQEAKDALMPYAEKEGKGAVLWPLRYALSGKEKSPDPFTLIGILGRDESLARLRNALAIL